MNETYYSLISHETWLVLLITITLTAIAGTVYFGLLLIKMKKANNSYSRIHCKEILRISNLLDENKSLRNSFDNLMVSNDVLASEIDRLEEKLDRRKDMVKLITASNIELRKSFEYAVAEISELKKHNEYLKSVKNHKKRPIEELETGFWMAKNQNYHQFEMGKVYEQSKFSGYTREHVLSLKCKTGTYLVNKSDFAPVSK